MGPQPRGETFGSLKKEASTCSAHNVLRIGCVETLTIPICFHPWDNTAYTEVLLYKLSAHNTGTSTVHMHILYNSRVSGWVWELGGHPWASKKLGRAKVEREKGQTFKAIPFPPLVLVETNPPLPLPPALLAQVRGCVTGKRRAWDPRRVLDSYFCAEFALMFITLYC